METALFQAWIRAKEIEAAATTERRAIENVLRRELGVQETLDGTENFHIGPYSVKVVGRIDRKVNADLLQEVAVEHGLENYLGHLFRWRPEVNLSAWKATDENVTNILAQAITSKPGRPSFSIKLDQED
jgi:hypothetical protein